MKGKTVRNPPGPLPSLGYQCCGGSSKPRCRAGGAQAMGMGSCPLQGWAALFFPEREKLDRGGFGSSTTSWGLLGGLGRRSDPQP